MTGLRNVVHARLAGEDGGTVHAHPARAADHHPAALAIRERAVVLVLDDVEHVEQRHPVGRLHLVTLQLLLAGLGVIAPDLQRNVDRRRAWCGGELGVQASTSFPGVATWSWSRASSRPSGRRRPS